MCLCVFVCVVLMCCTATFIELMADLVWKIKLDFQFVQTLQSVSECGSFCAYYLVVFFCFLLGSCFGYRRHHHHHSQLWMGKTSSIQRWHSSFYLKYFEFAFCDCQCARGVCVYWYHHHRCCRRRHRQFFFVLLWALVAIANHFWLCRKKVYISLYDHFYFVFFYTRSTRPKTELSAINGIFFHSFFRQITNRTRKMKIFSEKLLFIHDII